MLAQQRAQRQADRAALRRMGAAGRERFLAQYTSDRTHQALLRLYAEVLQLAPSALARTEIAGEA